MKTHGSSWIRLVPNATVTLWSPQSTASYAATTRKGEYYRGELPLNNSTGAVWLTITNLAVLNDGSNPDILTNATGNVFVPKTAEAFQYDRDGNLTNDGRWTYTWDAENRLTAMTSLSSAPAGSKRKLEFAYDAKGRRIQKIVSTWNGSSYVAQSTNRFVYDGWNLIAVLASNSSLLSSFNWGLDLSGSLHGAGGVGGLLAVNDASNGAHLCAYDGNGNLTVLVKATDGAVTANYEYGPFGEALRLTGAMAKANPFRFSTKYQDDETDLLYYGYRSYNPSTGKWLGRDPIEEKGGLSLYGFVANDSPNRYDVLGKYPEGGLHRFTLADMKAMLSQSKPNFVRKLKALCPTSQAVEWESAAGKQCCSPQSCRVQAELLALDMAAHLEVSFTTQFYRFFDVIAFTPMWLPSETINDRANGAPQKGEIHMDYDKGYGLKCTGMRDLMSRRFTKVIQPFRNDHRQCFKGSFTGNHTKEDKASHHWFGIYGPFNDDVRAIDVDVDPWFSAGGIISPDGRRFGQAAYFVHHLW